MKQEKAFRDIYDTHWYKLYVYSYNILRDKALAEDITQEVFVDLWNRFEEVEIKHYKAYLFKAVKFQCAKKLKEKSFDLVQIENIEYSLSSADDSSDFVSESKEKLIEKINLAAGEILPEKCLEVYELRYRYNLRYKDIADKLNISVSTVDNQLNKALKLLRASNLFTGELLNIILLSFFCFLQ
ncbi:sigma-70 family RNA polymerase sigma factor [Sinomicrobium sp.]